MEITVDSKTLGMTCFACPAQWEAKTVDGKDVYIRLRHGYFRLDLDGTTIFDGSPDGYDGVMNTEDMKEYITSNSEIRFS